jgi:hypothetical protein
MRNLFSEADLVKEYWVFENSSCPRLHDCRENAPFIPAGLKYFSLNVAKPIV